MRTLKVAAMDRIDPVARFTVPLGGQRIELQHVAFEAGGLAFLRVRIREGRRFTVFDLDPGSAADWAAAMLAWAEAQRRTAAEDVS